MISVGITVLRSENPEEDKLNNCSIDFSKIKRSVTGGDKEEYMDFLDFDKEEQNYIIKCLEAIIKTYRQPTVEEIRESFK